MIRGSKLPFTVLGLRGPYPAGNQRLRSQGIPVDSILIEVVNSMKGPLALMGELSKESPRNGRSGGVQRLRIVCELLFFVRKNLPLTATEYFGILISRSPKLRSFS
jgi:hypothetical protein